MNGMSQLDVCGEAIGGDELLAAVIALVVAVIAGVQLKVSSRKITAQVNLYPRINILSALPVKHPLSPEDVFRADAALERSIVDMSVANVMAEVVRD